MVSRPSSYNYPSSPSSTYSYAFAPGYMRPHTDLAPVSGYPYIPHNATTQEREACNSRIQDIRARNAFYNRPAQPVALNPEAYRLRPGARPGSLDISIDEPSSSEPSVDTNPSSEGEDSSGPETPYSHDRFIWKDSADDGAEKANLDHPRPQEQNSFDSHDYYPPAPPVVPEETHRGGSVSESFTTAASAAARKEVQRLTYEFNNLVLGFKFPSNLEFTKSPNDGELPKLVHTPASKPLLEHNHKLEKLLERLDAIESHGDKEIQRMRKQAVERMLSELDGLKRMEAMAFYNFNFERAM